MRLPGDIDLAMAFAVWRRNLTVYRRTWRMNILPNFFEPLLYLVGMGVGLGGYLGEEVGGMPYIAWLAPGLMASSAMNGATFETTYNIFVKMTFGRLYDAFLGTPAQIQDLVAGEVMWAVSRGLVYGLAFVAVAAVTGPLTGAVSLQSPWALLLPFAFVLIAALFAAFGALFTSLVRSIDLYSWYYTLFLTPLFLFSGIFFPVERFPYGAHIAFFTPLHHAVNVCRDLSHGTVAVDTGVSTVWMLVVAMVLLSFVPGRLRARLTR
jgi:lipooligosaccharide transport system permease protein